LAILAAIRRASSSLILIKVQICQTVLQWRSKYASMDSLSSKDLLEACVAFAVGLTFVIAFHWMK
jgi:hypothetical protein